MFNLTKEQAVRMGGELARVMESDTFRTTVEVLREQYRADFFSSGPSDRDKREWAYQQNTALDDLVSTMQTLAHVAEQESQRIERDETED